MSLWKQWADKTHHYWCRNQAQNVSKWMAIIWGKHKWKIQSLMVGTKKQKMTPIRSDHCTEHGMVIKVIGVIRVCNIIKPECCKQSWYQTPTVVEAMIERPILSQILPYLNAPKILPTTQSGFRQLHVPRWHTLFALGLTTLVHLLPVFHQAHRKWGCTGVAAHPGKN